MELWLCKRNEFGLLKDDRKISFFRVNNPHQPIETLEYMSGKTKTTARAFIDDLVTKHGMLKAGISNNPLPPSKNECVYVQDYDEIHSVRLLGMAAGHKMLTFLAKVNDENCYVQFFVRNHRNRYSVRCRARTRFLLEYATDEREAGNYLGFLIFEH